LKSWQLSDGLTKTVPPDELEFPVLPEPATQLRAAADAPELLSSTPDTASERVTPAHAAITVTRRAFEMMLMPCLSPFAGLVSLPTMTCPCRSGR
jgi:hypothetical protein